MRGEVNAVDGVDLRLERGRTLGIVGESGCGKSVTALSIMGLVPQPPGRIAAGEILFEGEDLLKLPPERLRDLRGDKLSMIFQEPMTSLNPVFPVGDQIAEAILRHRGPRGRRGRDVRGEDREPLRGAGAVLRAAAPLHGRALRLDPAP